MVHKYSMKYDFSTYLKHALNEADTPKDENPGYKTFKKDFNNADTEDLEELFKELELQFKDNNLTSVKYKDQSITPNKFKEALSLMLKNGFDNEFSEVKDDIELKNDKDKSIKKKFITYYDSLKKTVKPKSKSGSSSGYSKNKNDFEKLGEAIVFRTACSFSKNVDDFSKICKQIFDNDSDDRIKSLTTIETQMGEYGAIKGFEEFKEKNKKTNDDEAKSILERCEPFYQKLIDQSTPDVEVLDAIDQISASIPQEFKKFYEEAQGAFEQGRENMNKNIKDPNFKWEDPITGKKAEGVDNIKAGLQKFANNLGEKADELGKKIMSSPHNLENDMMKVGVIALKVMLGGVKGIRKIANFFGFGKRSASADAFIKGCKDSKSSIKTLLDKFGSFLSKNVNLWKAFKNISNKSDSKSSGEGINDSYEMSFVDYILNEDDNKPAEEQPTEEKKEPEKKEEKKDNLQEARDKFFNDPAGFKNTGYHILDYITKNVCYLIKLANSDDLKICKIEKLENSDNTYGLTFTKSGSMTMVQDKLNLYIKSLQFYIDFCDTIEKNIKGINDKLYLGDLMATANEFDFNRTQLIKSCDKILNNEDFKQNEKLKKNIEAIKLLYSEKEGFSQISQKFLKITKDPKGFSSGGTSLNTFKAGVKQTIDRLSKLKIEPLAEAATVKFETEEDFNKFTKDLTKAFGGNFEPFKSDEEEGDTGSSIKSDYEEIQKSLKELKDTNKINDVKDKFNTINDKLNSTVKSVDTMISKLADDDERKTSAQNIKVDKNTTLDKIIYIKAAMKALNLTESVALNEIVKILNEDTEGTPDVESIKKEISEIIDGEITLDNVSSFTDKSKKVYKEIEALYNAQNDDTKKKLEEYKDKPLQLLYAIGAIEGVKKEEPAPAPVDANQTQDAINKTKQAIETAEDTDTIFNDEYYDELKGDLKGVYSTIDEMTKNNDELLQEFLNIKIDDDIKDELLPQLWHYKRFLTILFDKQKEAKKQEEGKKDIKDSYNPFYAHDMLVLLEAETEENKDNNNVVEALKAKTKAIKEILAKQDVAEFNKAYKVWKDEINKLLEKFDKIENKDKLTDPLQKLSAMGNYIKNKPEEKKEENPQPAEGGAKSDKSGEIKKS